MRPKITFTAGSLWLLDTSQLIWKQEKMLTALQNTLTEILIGAVDVKFYQFLAFSYIIPAVKHEDESVMTLGRLAAGGIGEITDWRGLQVPALKGRTRDLLTYWTLDCWLWPR